MLKPETLPFAALLTALTAFGPLATDMYLPSLPAMAADFATDVGTVQLTLSVFLAGFGIAQLMVGPLSDRFGRRPVLMVGVGLYFVATAACAFAPTIELLIGLRFVQAVGACTGVVVARAVVRDVYGRDRAAKVLAYMGTAMALAPVIAPVIGGYLVMWSGWRAIFAALALFGLILLLLVWRQLGETNEFKDATATRPSWLARNYVTLLGDRTYVGYVLVNTFVFCGMFAFISGSSFVLIKFMGLPPHLFGMCFGIAVLGYMSGTVIAGKLTLKFGIDAMLSAGGVVAMAGGVGMFGLAMAGVDHAAAVIGPQFVYMIGMGIVMPNAIAGAIGPYPKMAGTASALLGFVQMAAAALTGLAVGQLDNGTQIPMTTAIALSGTFTFIAYFIMIRPNPRP